MKKLIYFAIIFIPLYLVKIKIFNLPTNLWEIIFGIIFVFWIFQRRQEIKIREFYYNYKKYIFSVGLVIIGLVISTVFSGSNLYSWGIIKSWFLIPVVFMLMAADIVPKEKTKNIFWAYYLSAFLVAFIALFYLILSKMTFDERLEAFFNSPNYLAMYLAPAIIIALGNKVKNIFLKISLLVILIVFYFTYSYAAWMSVVVSLIVLFFIQKKISFRKILIIAAIFILLIFSQLKNKKLEDLVSLNSRSSLASREMIWKASAKMIRRNFLFGIGPGNFQKTYLDYQKFYSPYLEWAVPHPHNLYLAFWLDGGIAGFLGFLTLVVFYFKDILGKIKRPQNAEIVYVSLAIMFYILIHGLVDTTYFKNDLAIVFWLNFLALKL